MQSSFTIYPHVAKCAIKRKKKTDRTIGLEFEIETRKIIII